MLVMSALSRAKSLFSGVETVGCAPIGTNGAWVNMTTVAPVSVNSFRRWLNLFVKTEYHCGEPGVRTF